MTEVNGIMKLRVENKRTEVSEPQANSLSEHVGYLYLWVVSWLAEPMSPASVYPLALLSLQILPKILLVYVKTPRRGVTNRDGHEYHEYEYHHEYFKSCIRIRRIIYSANTNKFCQDGASPLQGRLDSLTPYTS